MYATLYQTLGQVLSYESSDIVKNTFFIEHFQTTTSVFCLELFLVEFLIFIWSISDLAFFLLIFNKLSHYCHLPSWLLHFYQTII